MVFVQIIFLAGFLQVCICEPAPKPLDTINVHFHLDESEESTEDKGENNRRGYTNEGSNNRGDYFTPEDMERNSGDYFTPEDMERNRGDYFTPEDMERNRGDYFTPGK
ncbi:uncharacterized protein LOC111703317 [Eurytemora carolleeae]|uniref:uncharacterized protein LOC111703317 n=1 Tax=Eurytemora carolleeae TaxID=1294199 RepID=UPI000C76572E|nr:uncharacterized protein LOC111703317 [Eurytemora carolleeae]|eukprot:XP_023330992.1 uncharacterized protein LOC111703317 [Eurytemora affinis]